ncbi:MarR family transcriptional regulator [Pediococcus argentinicus]|nr:MarR family transcriptional regulator [Pediococcus argentinicus]
MQNLNLNQQQGRTLQYIGLHEGLIQKDLADAFLLRGATISSMLQGLEQKGYIERRVPSDNERQKQIFLSERGSKVLADVNQVFIDSQKKLKQTINDKEYQELIRLLRAVNQNM